MTEREIAAAARDFTRQRKEAEVSWLRQLWLAWRELIDGFVSESCDRDARRKRDEVRRAAKDRL